MTIHYHGTPLTPNAQLETLAGRCFCVSYARPDQVERCHQIGASVLLDNGAFTLWKQKVQMHPNWWESYYGWAERWLSYPTTWAVIPDVIEGSEEDNDALIGCWPFGHRGAPVWHAHESIERLEDLVAHWPRVCIGSSAQYADMNSVRWHHRMEQAFNAVWVDGPKAPWLHLLRGLDKVGGPFPFASADSTNVAQNHHRPPENALQMARRLDAVQCSSTWDRREHMELVTSE